MKRITAIIAVLALCLAITACGSSSPTEVTNSYLSAVKAEDTKTISEVYAGDNSDIAFDNAAEVAPDAYGEALTNSLKEKFLAFEYQVSNEKIDGDTATVDVAIKTYSFGNTFRDAISEYFTQAFSMLFSNPSKEEMDALMEQILAEKMETAAFDYEGTSTLTLTKTDGNWIVDEIDDGSAFLNTVSGGMLDFASEMEDAFADGQ